jgi:hypothetical protein
MWRGAGVFIPQPPKIAVGRLSSGDSEYFFGDSGHHLRRVRRCAEAPHMFGLWTLHRNPMTGDSGKISRNSGLFLQDHSKDIPCVV